MWTNMSTRSTLPWILVQGPKGFSNFENKYMSTNVVFILYDSDGIDEICGNVFIPFNSLWFPTTMESRCFDVPAPKHLCTSMTGFGWWASSEVSFNLMLNYIYWLRIWFPLFPWKHMRDYISCGQISPPLALISGEEWFIKYLHSFWHFTAGI